MISKELFSEVLQVRLSNNPIGFDKVGNEHWYIDYFERNKKINIYELAHKCKEWAVHLLPNKQALSSYPRWGNLRDYPNTNGEYYVCQHLVSGIQFEAETEPEAIFKACQWILDNK